MELGLSVCPPAVPHVLAPFIFYIKGQTLFTLFMPSLLNSLGYTKKRNTFSIS